MKKRRISALILVGVLAASTLAGCGSSSDSSSSSDAEEETEEAAEAEDTAEEATESMAQAGTPVAGTSDETLTVACDGEPTSIFPNYVTNKTSNRVDSCMFDTLVRWNDETKTAEPCLATEWEWIDDTHIEFTLRDDVYFTDGNQMTAKDVQASLQASYDYTLNHYALMFDMDNFEIEDDQHIIIALSKPYGNLIDILGCTYYAIFSSEAFDAVGDDETVFCMDPVGSGPYKLESWNTGEKLTLVRNDDWWDTENMPYYQYIEFYFIDDPTSRASALEAGDVDVAFNLATNQVPELQAYDDIYVDIYEQNVTKPFTFMMINYPVLQDENVRQAILLALDKDMIAQAAYDGYATVSRSSLLAQTSPYYTETESYEQDVETAKQLIEDSGYSAEDLTFTAYAVSGDSTATDEVVQAELAAIGVTYNIETVDLTVMLEHSWAGEIAIGFGEIDTWDVGRTCEFYDSRIETSTNAYVGEDEDHFHDLLDAAYAASTEEERAAAYADVSEFLTDHWVCTTVSAIIFPCAWRSNLTNVSYDAHCWPNIWSIRPIAE